MCALQSLTWPGSPPPEKFVAFAFQKLFCFCSLSSRRRLCCLECHVLSLLPPPPSALLMQAGMAKCLMEINFSLESESNCAIKERKRVESGALAHVKPAQWRVLCSAEESSTTYSRRRLPRNISRSPRPRRLRPQGEIKEIPTSGDLKRLPAHPHVMTAACLRCRS